MDIVVVLGKVYDKGSIEIVTELTVLFLVLDIRAHGKSRKGALSFALVHPF